MTRKNFLRTTAGLAVTPWAAKPARRSLVFILSDDHSYNTLGCMGHLWLKTPGMDRMAKGGAVFRNAFVTTSLCSPSRASILTGQYAHAHCVNTNASQYPKNAVTFPELLRAHGYRTSFMGIDAYHTGFISFDAPQPRFDHWISFDSRVCNDPILNVNGHRRKGNGYWTDILTEEALRFIADNAHRPFCLFLSHKAPHSSCEPARRHQNLYSTEPILYPRSMANTEENYRGKPDWVRRQRKSWHGVDGMYDGKISLDHFYRDYCRTLMSLDDSVGQVLSGLEEKGLLNDTLVIYMSDNGFQFGEHGLIDKRTMYEASIRVPLIAHCPDLFEGNRIVDGMALNIDIAPTWLEAASVEVPRGMHGRSLLPLLRGSTEGRSKFLYEYYWERGQPHTPTVLGLRTERYSYMDFYGVWDLNELYDNQEDPDQMNNLLGQVRVTTQSGGILAQIKNPDLRRLVGDLQKKMHQILTETGGRPEPSWLALGE